MLTGSVFVRCGTPGTGSSRRLLVEMGICFFCEGEGDGDGAGRGAAWGRADVEQQQANRTAAAILIALLSWDVYHREECIDGPKGKLKSEARFEIEGVCESWNNPRKKV